MNKQQLANKIWASANKMRSKIEASEYKDYILGFIFYKFLSEKEENYLKDKGWSKNDILNLDENDEETVAFLQENIGYFISYHNLFSTWLIENKNFNFSRVVDALSAFDRLISLDYIKVFKDIFKTLQNGLDRLGDTSGAKTKAITGLIDLIKDIPMDDRQDYDVLGFIYEYLISNFAANAGKKAGEFYTPHEVSLLMSKIVANHIGNRKEIEIYDPTSGSGSLLINIGRSIAKQKNSADNIKYYAQELKDATYNLTRMNLIMRGILPSNIITRCGDTLDKDWPIIDEKNKYSPLYVDAVVSNPPYSQAWDANNHLNDVRFANYGIAPKGKADYAFLLHDLYHLKPDGIMTIVLPHGVLFRSGEEEKIRSRLIELDNIETIIGLPPHIFFGTSISTIIMVLKKNRNTSNVLFIDASKYFIKEGKNNKLRASDIKRIMDVVIERENSPKNNKFSRVVSKQEIIENNYNLNISRYVDSNDDDDVYDLCATMYGGIPWKEINSFDKYFSLFPTLKNELFGYENDKGYTKLEVPDIRKSVLNNDSVIKFAEKYDYIFNDFSDYLKRMFFSNLMNLDVYETENLIANDIFKRLTNVPMIDKYEAFQMLDDKYRLISQDIEIIQTEGLDALKIVDDKIVVKTKNGNSHEMHDGWVGHVIPFELVKTTLLSKNSDEISSILDKISINESNYKDVFLNLTEEEKEDIDSLINEDGDDFIIKEVKIYVKALNKSKVRYAVGTIEQKMIYVINLVEENKELKKLYKNKSEELEKLTKSTIESLSTETALILLGEKWILPIVDGISALKNNFIESFINNLIHLSDKYKYNLIENSDSLDKEKIELANMIDDLEGDESDIRGLKELQKILRGSKNE